MAFDDESQLQEIEGCLKKALSVNAALNKFREYCKEWDPEAMFRVAHLEAWTAMSLQPNHELWYYDQQGYAGRQSGFAIVGNGKVIDSYPLLSIFWDPNITVEDIHPT